MNHLKKIFEYNKSDKNLINNYDYTLSLEIELETLDKKEANKISIDILREIILNNCKKFIKDNKKEDSYLKIIKKLLSEISYDDDYNEDVFSEYKKYSKDDFEENLFEVAYSDYLTYFNSDNIKYLEDKVKENLPNFYKNWNNLIKFELDNTLERGIEFSHKKYLNSLTEIIQYINDFYKDFENQNYWIMTKSTGIHVNIGLKENKDWNVLKGVVMISDDGKGSFIFKDMEHRIKSLYSKSYITNLKKDIKDDKIIKLEDFKKIIKLEITFSDYLISKLKEYGYKNFGFNITRIKDNYIEFRYPGGEVKKKVLIEKVYYFCYIVKLMTEKKFKRRSYIKKLYKFINNL